MRKYNRQDRGQATLMLAMMVLTFLFFFQFVVSTGLLINAKINLQNAADMAAYAGAATQARQLNDIGVLNYEMRRYYKKFLFRYYAVGGFAQASFPPGKEGQNGMRRWMPDPDKFGNVDYRVPVVCVIYNHKDNYCQVPLVKKIPELKNVSSINAIQNALANQLDSFEEVRQAQCASIGNLNRDLLGYWLFKSDPGDERIQQAIDRAQLGQNFGKYGADNLRKTFDTIKRLSTGLGLVPKTLLLHSRIKTLEKYVNSRPEKEEINLEFVNDLKERDEAAKYERTIQAFLSAYNTLGEHVFSSDGIVMNELLPEGKDGTELLSLEDILINFEAYYLAYTKEGEAVPITGVDGKSRTDCKGFPFPIPIRNLPIGVYKNPNILTYYAIRLKAPAHILFSPFGSITLKAYSAAKPFGSRLGPRFPELALQDKQNMFVIPEMKAVTGNGSVISNCGGNCFGIPNLPIEADDTIVEGWNRHAVLTHLMSNQFLQRDGADPSVVQDFEHAYRAAMVPNPWERGKYLIPNDFGANPQDHLDTTTGDPFQIFFDQNLTYSLWAPVQSLESSTEKGIREFFQEAISSLNSAPSTDFSKIRDALVAVMLDYVNDLNDGRGEGGETFTIARISDSLREKRPGGEVVNIPVSTQNPAILMDKLEDLRTSWTNENNENFAEKRRVGYSVKYISFKTLMNPGSVATDIDGSEHWSNTSSIMDAEAEIDLGGNQAAAIQH